MYEQDAIHVSCTTIMRRCVIDIGLFNAFDTHTYEIELNFILEEKKKS